MLIITKSMSTIKSWFRMILSKFTKFLFVCQNTDTDSIYGSRPRPFVLRGGWHVCILSASHPTFFLIEERRVIIRFMYKKFVLAK